MHAPAEKPNFAKLRRELKEIQAALREQKLDGWLLYDLRARNPIAGKLTGHGELSRRYFVMIPAEGEPHALSHAIEDGPWAKWPWQRSVYSAWPRLEELIRELTRGRKRVAMEISERDNVPVNDLVPAGVVELVRSSGVDVVTSGDLISQFYSKWNAEDLASHRRAAAIVAQVAHASFQRIGRAIAAGETVTEAAGQAWVVEDLIARGLPVGAGCMVAGPIGAANPHYDIVGNGAELKRGDTVLIDLWGKESDDAIFADQTWMGYLGSEVPDRAASIFSVIRDARDAGVRFLEDAWRGGRKVVGGEVDDVVRNVVVAGGYGDAFVHRTGHSIDRAIHGMGPNIDNLETRETRTLIVGVGFSIEPGIYLQGDVGMRTEINVYMSENGPEVTTPGPQTSILTLLP